MRMYYFTDAMCSWCWGFSPAIKKLKENYPGIDLQIISGGFSPGSMQLITDEYRSFLEYHWRNVHARSGQPFDHSMKFATNTFRYDTEPASRALIVIQRLLPGKDFEFLSLMQKSFYAEGKDITNDRVLVDLAEASGVNKDIFLADFHSEEMTRKTRQGFQFSRQLGVQGFPTLLTLEFGSIKIITHGFQTYDHLKVLVDNWLENISGSQAVNGQSCSEASCDC